MLVNAILGILKKKGIDIVIEPEHGIVAGVIEDPIEKKYVEGATVAIDPADEFTKYFYIPENILYTQELISQTDSSGTFIVANAPSGKAVITAYAGEPTAPIGSTRLVVYENSVAIANILKK